MAKRIRNATLTNDLDFYNEVTEKSSLDKGDKKINTKKRKFQAKLESNSLNEFEHSDWRYYFQMMYQQATGKPCIMNGVTVNTKAKSIITALMSDYKPQDIKAIIDFLFLADHDIEEHKTCITISMLSRNWVMHIYPKADLWRQGKYKKRPKKKAPIEREWTNKPNILSDDDDEIF